MAETSIVRLLQKFFPGASRSDWKEMAMQETGGKDPYEFLSWRGKDDILFSPYYDALDVAALPYTKQSSLSVPSTSSPEERPWHNLPAILSDNVVQANASALEHLTCGADGVLFDLQNFNLTDLNLLLKEIEWPYCVLSFMPNEQEKIFHTIAEYVEARFDPASVRGALFWESCPKKSNPDFFIERCGQFHSLGLRIEPDTPAVEISEALLKGVDAYNTFANENNKESVLRNICFLITAESPFLENVAKLRALRILWQQIAMAYGHHDYRVADLYVHVQSLPVEDGAFAPQENMQKGTFAAMAAVLGGCNALTVMPAQHSGFVSRWSRNVSAILREEAFLGQVDDAMAGSYALEVLTYRIAEKAWSLFQSKCKTR